MTMFHHYSSGSGIFSLNTVFSDTLWDAFYWDADVWDIDEVMSGSTVIVRIVNSNNTFKERFRQTRFINTGSTDANIDTGSFIAIF